VVQIADLMQYCMLVVQTSGF